MRFTVTVPSVTILIHRICTAARGGERVSEKQGGQQHKDVGHRRGEQIENDFLQVPINESSFFNGMDSGGEVVVRDDDFGGALGDFGAGDAHGHAHVA